MAMIWGKINQKNGKNKRCDAPIFGGPVDNPSTCEISVLGCLAPKS